jgi:hypothetical protein
VAIEAPEYILRSFDHFVVVDWLVIVGLIGDQDSGFFFIRTYYFHNFLAISELCAS